MKNLLTLVWVSLMASWGYSQTTYYTCAAAPTPTTNLTTASDGSGSCSVTQAVWNVSGNTVVARSGTSYLDFVSPTAIACDVTVESGATLNISTQGNNKAISFLSTCSLSVAGTIQTDPNLAITNDGYLHVTSTGNLDNSGSANNNITISGTGTALIEGNLIAGDRLIVDGSVIITGTMTGDVVVVSGSVTGSGTITGTSTFGGTGTINGVTANDITSPATLTAIGYTWSGTNWAATSGSNTKTTLAPTDKAFINGTDYNTGTSGDIVASDIEVTTNNLTVAAGDSAIAELNIINNGTITSEDHGILYAKSGVKSGGSGTFVIKRNFTRTGWHFISFPTKANTVADIVGTGVTIDYSGTSAQTLYQWDNATSVWSNATGATSLAGTPLALYADASSSSVSLTIASNDMNMVDMAASFNYHNPGSTTNDSTANGTGWTSGSATDGWNLFVNPFQTFIDVDKLSISGLNSAIYVFDGSTYKSYIQNGTGDVEAHFISPHQAFFVQSTGGTGTLTLDNAATTSTPSSFTNTFKQNREVKIELVGANTKVWTYLNEHYESSNAFDGRYDAYYLEPWSDAPIFSSTNTVDSVDYHIQTVPFIHEAPIYLTMNYSVQNEPFLVHLSDVQKGNLEYLYLSDLHTGQTVDLLTSDYSFTHDSLAPRQRFKLSFSAESTMTSTAELSNDGDHWSVWSQGGSLQSSRTDCERIDVYGMDGRLITSSCNVESIKLNSGLYVLNGTFNDGKNISIKVAIP